MSQALIRELRALLEEAERPSVPNFDSMTDEELLRYWEEDMAPRLRGERTPRTSRKQQGTGYHPYDSMTDEELKEEWARLQARSREQGGTDPLRPFRGPSPSDRSSNP